MQTPQAEQVQFSSIILEKDKLTSPVAGMSRNGIISPARANDSRKMGWGKIQESRNIKKGLKT